MPDKTLKTRIWISSDRIPEFPEQREPYLGRLEERPGIGLCFSGGGTRALAAAMGQYRALDHIGALERARYISSVSGGTWASSLFTFYRSGDGLPADDAEFLGPITPPGEITRRGLTRLPRTRLGYVATLSLRDALFDLAKKKVPADRLWIEAVGRTYLRNFGLYDPEDPAYFSLDDETVHRIKGANPELEHATFHTVRKEGHRPFLVMNSCIVGPSSVAPFALEDLVHFEYTPLAVGSSHPLTVTFTSKERKKGYRTREVGGGFIELFAFGGAASRKAPGECRAEKPPTTCTLDGLPLPPRPYTLADAAGTSSAAPAAIFDRIAPGIDQLGPQVTYWPVREAADPPAEKFDFGDGGSLENYGVIPLLQRKVRRLVVFINTSVKLDPGYDPSWVPQSSDLDSDLPPLFGFPMGVQRNNQVFPTEEFKPLVRALQAAKRAGGTAMVEYRHRVQDNPWWGVRGGWTANILWFYLDRVETWERQLPFWIRFWIKLGNNPILPIGPYRNFPNYDTVDENLLDIVQLTRRQVNLLADLTCWNLTEHRRVIDEFLGPGRDPGD